MNILDRIPFLKPDATEQEVAEYDEAQARIDRIAFHRDHVRNGPANFKQPTNGQVKRAQKRALARDTKRARRAQIRRHLAEQREASTLGAHLRAAGVLAYASEDFRPSGDQIVASVSWIAANFAQVEPDEQGRIRLTEDVVVGALTAALNRWQAIVGHPVTKLSPAYVLPVTLSA